MLKMLTDVAQPREKRSGEGVPGDRPCGCFVNAKFLLLNNFTLSETPTSTVLKF